MLTMGLTLTTNDFKILAQRPLDVFIGACAQFIIMPGVAYTLVHVWHLDPALSLGILLVNTLGYLLGWLAGKLAGFNTAKKRTISIEVGMQNAGLATVLAGNFFAAQPLAVLPCAISCAWHSISGTILAGIYLKWDRMHEKK